MSPPVSEAAAAPTPAERRHSTRLSVSVPVMVSGTDSSGVAFREEWKTVSINRRGAIIETVRPIDPGAELLIRNCSLGIVVRARVIRFIKARTPGERPQVALELLDLKNVWGIQYPPRDWQLPVPPQVETQASSPPLVPPGEVEVDLTGSLAELLTASENHSMSLDDDPVLSPREPAAETPSPGEERNRLIEESPPELVALEERLRNLAQSAQASCATLESLLSRVKETEQHVEKLLAQTWVRLGEQQLRIASDTEQKISGAAEAALDGFLAQLREATDAFAGAAPNSAELQPVGARKPARRRSKNAENVA